MLRPSYYQDAGNPLQSHLVTFVLFGRQHRDKLAGVLVDHDNHYRSDMERDHLSPVQEAPEELETVELDRLWSSALSADS